MRELDKEGKVVDPAALQAAENEPASATTTHRSKADEKEGVFVVEQGQARFRPVKTGIVGETELEITDGLKEGDEIVSGSYKTLRTLKDQARIKLETKKKDK